MRTRHQRRCPSTPRRRMVKGSGRSCLAIAISARRSATLSNFRHPRPTGSTAISMGNGTASCPTAMILPRPSATHRTLAGRRSLKTGDTRISLRFANKLFEAELSSSNCRKPSNRRSAKRSIARSPYFYSFPTHGEQIRAEKLNNSAITLTKPPCKDVDHGLGQIAQTFFAVIFGRWPPVQPAAAVRRERPHRESPAPALQDRSGPSRCG